MPNGSAGDSNIAAPQGLVEDFKLLGWANSVWNHKHVATSGPYVPTSYTAHGVLIGNGTGSIAVTSVGATNTVLHGNTGADPTYSAVVEADITLADNTTNDASTSKHGFLKKLDNNSAHFMDGQGNWSSPSSSGGIATIASGSFPAAATLSITNIAATYAYLIIKVTGASSNTATRHPRIQVSTNNGSSYDTTAGNYELNGSASGDASLVGNGWSDDVAAATFSALIYIFGYQGGPNMHWTYRAVDGSGTITCASSNHYIGSTSAINAIQFLWNGSGNFDAGTYALYGVS